MIEVYNHSSKGITMAHYIEEEEKLQSPKSNAFNNIHLPDHRHLRDANILRQRCESQLINRNRQF